MIRHLFKLIWNKKSTHALLIVEIWASFMVLFGLTTLIVYNVKNYLEPLGFEYENVWAVNLNSNQDTVALANKIDMIFQLVKTYPEIGSVSRMNGCYPLSQNNNGTGAKYKNAGTGMNFIIADENLAKTINMNLVAGKWFRNIDSVGKYKPIVINVKAQEKLFENESPIGKVISNDDGKPTWIISGVVDYYKDKGEFMENKPTMIELLSSKNYWDRTLVIKVKSGMDAVFEAKMVKGITSIVKDWSTEVIHLDEARQKQHDITIIPVVIFLIVCSFLLINVALGLFGILNLSISQRRGEIGLRRAMGATEGKVTVQFLGEIWVLATLSIIIGLLFAVQFPLMNVFDVASGIYLTAIFASIIVIFIIVTICAWFPSRQASRIHPALALHED